MRTEEPPTFPTWLLFSATADALVDSRFQSRSAGSTRRSSLPTLTLLVFPLSSAPIPNPDCTLTQAKHKVSGTITRVRIIKWALPPEPRERVATRIARGVLQLVLDLHQAVVLRIALAA